MNKKCRAVFAAASVLAAWVFLGAGPAWADGETISLITKTNTNPVFVFMREAVVARAKELNVKLITFAGKYDGDNASQVDALENSIAAGAKAILIVPNDTKAIVPQVLAARKAGVLVMVMNSPLVPADAADGTFATDNVKAGMVDGEWVKATLGPKAATARIAMLDADTLMVSNNVNRDVGFMEGFGIDVPNKSVWGSEHDPRIVGHDVTQGSPSGGQRAMENLLQAHPDINVVYAMNEQAIAGAYQALKAAGRDKDTLIVTVDGTCQGIQMIADGAIGATAMQFWLTMATDALDAAVKELRTGEKPQNSPGLDFFDTGVKLLTNHPVAGVPSINSDEALKLRGPACAKS